MACADPCARGPTGWLLSHDLWPWHTVYEQARRWKQAGVWGQRGSFSCILRANCFTSGGTDGLDEKSLTLDAESLRELAERRGTSESAVVREVIADALFAEELVDLLQQLHDAGFALTGADGTGLRLPSDGQRSN